MVAFATQVKRRRGTTAQNEAFTGAEGEIVVDTQKHTLRVHDGETQGGFEIARQADLSDKAATSYVDSQLALKANADLSNVSGNLDYVVESQEPTSSNSYTWYRKYKSGWVEQGGRVSLNGVISATNKRVTFPVEMVDSKYDASVAANANVGAVPYVGWESTTSMSVGLMSGTSTGQTSWRVAGMAKQ